MTTLRYILDVLGWYPSLSYLGLLVGYVAMQAWILRSPRLSGRLLVAAGIVPLAFFLWLGVMYLLAPSFRDHVEASVTMNALQVSVGDPIYGASDAAERTGILYGPGAAVVGALFQRLISDPILAAKATGIVLAWSGLALLFVALARARSPADAMLAVVVSVMYFLLHEHMAFWCRPDSLQIFGVGLMTAAVYARSRRAAVMLTALALAVLVNAKIHGPFYVLPLLLLFWQRHGWRQSLVAGVLGIAVSLAPFLLSSVSLGGYLTWLFMFSRTHVYNPEIVVWNLSYLILYVVPAAAVLWHARGSRAVPVGEWALHGSFLLVLGFVMLFGSKGGSGPWHFLSVAPVLGVLVAESAYRTRRAMPQGGEDRVASRRRVMMLMTPWLIVMVVAIRHSQQDFVSTLRWEEPRRARVEIEAIVRDHSGKTLMLSYGDERGRPYGHTDLRPVLFRYGQFHVFDRAALWNMPLAARIPPATLDWVRREPVDLVLIPKGQPPFEPASFYGEALSRVFHEHYRLIESQEFFDLWQSRRLGP